MTNPITITEDQDLSQIPLSDVTVLDFSQVHYVSTHQIGQIITLFNRAEDRTIRIENMREEIRAIFAQIGLTAIYDSVSLPSV